MRKLKTSLNSVKFQQLYESYFLLEKNPAFSEVQRYVCDSLLKHPLTRNNTFSLIRVCGEDVCNVEKSKKKILENPESFAAATFR